VTKRLSLGTTFSALPVVAVWLVIASAPVQGQVRGVYPLGMNATNAGVTPESGFTYSNLFVFNSRDEKKDASGETVATGNQAVMMDLNTFVWVSQKIRILGDALFSASATLPFANNSLSSDVTGPVSGGGGFADSFYQPAILGWRMERADLRAAFGFLAPTGRFTAGANTNVGSGYWTWVGSAGQTLYLTRSRNTAVSAFQMYEFHSTQEGTGVHPGQNLNLDYSLTQTLPLDEGLRLQLGLVGYAQWQTTDKTGPSGTPDQAAAHYQVYALGFAANVIFPARKVTAGVKYFQEFASNSTYQGYTLQISFAITL
jgi:hypothetical protein